MSEHRYTIILHPDVEEGGYTVTVPALPGCVTQGETIEDAIRLHNQKTMSPLPSSWESDMKIRRKQS